MDISMHPIGELKVVKELDEFVLKCKQEWQVLKPVSRSWKILKFEAQEFVAIVKYLLFCTDLVVILVEKAIPGETGADKKATVLATMSVIYDFVAIGAFPKILLPWQGAIKSFVIYVLMSGLIDYMVGKYNEGNWVNQGGYDVKKSF